MSSTSESHGHSHSHRRRGSSRRRSRWINIISCSVSVILIIVLAVQSDSLWSKNKDSGNHSQITNSTVIVESSVYTEDVLLVSAPVFNYMDSANPKDAQSLYKTFDGWKYKLNEGQPWKLFYQVMGLPAGVMVESAELEIAENDTYKNAKSYKLDPKEHEFGVYNLKSGTKYFYRLSFSLSNGSVAGSVGDFKTVDTTRVLNIDGAVNVRDIGGYKTIDGKRIKQGMLYRGSELDGKVEKNYCLTEKGKTQMLEDLNIRFDLDLRGKELAKDNKDALGKDVKHKYYGASTYTGFLLAEHNAITKQIFADLANKNNYPIYMHCTYGRDRTGTVAYLLEALLGVDDETLYKEYALSAFTDSYIETENFEKFIADIQKMPGKTTQQKVEKWLLSIGVTNAQIRNIRNILLEG